MSRVAEIRRATPTLLRVGFASAIAYRSEFLVWILATNMPLVMLLLWTAVAAEAPVGRFGETEFIGYFLATLIVRLLTGSWVVWELNFEIRQGTLGMRLLKPMHPFLVFAADNLAAIPMRVLVSLPIAAGALFWVGRETLTGDLLLWAAVPVALLGAWLMTFCVMALIGTLGLFWESSLSIFELWLGLFFVLSGYILPLELLPEWLWAVARWLPFRFLLSFPVELMLGLVDREGLAVGLCVQWLYVAFFLVAGLRLWAAGLKRYAAYGG
ncbi:ABC transporter permease [Vulgatibacter sp.]|uniref:ABC transporter permease n=1 Tax=Vulgatibacter sp. TaxID=1971226 RepID=UPI003563CAF5